LRFCTSRAVPTIYLPWTGSELFFREEGLTTAEVAEIEVKDESAARMVKFFGSPTIRVNGLDIEIDLRNIRDTALACRRYLGELPFEEIIRLALREAQVKVKYA
jgi:hypothetical protein